MADTGYGAPPSRKPSDADSEDVDERLNVTKVKPDEPDNQDTTTTASPMADELDDGFLDQLDDVEQDDHVETKVPVATDDDGRDLTILTEPEADTIGDIIDWRYSDTAEKWVVLQTKDEQVMRAAQSPEQTVQDWVALIRAGDWRLDDVEARPYQDWTDEQMRERVDAALRGGER